MTPGRFELHIDELVVNGVDGVGGAELGPAVERELARLVTDRGTPSLWTCDGAVATVDGGAFDVSSGAGVEAVGAQIAQAVYRGGSR